MKNVALVGTAPASMHQAPFGNPEWEVWGCSPGTYMYGDQFHRFFELHRWEPGQPWFSEGYVKFLQEFPGEVVMSEAVPSVKNCTLLPWRQLVEKYSDYFFTSSLAWMMAMAIESGAKKIGLWGVDMAATTEYHDQRMGCQFFALIARSMGIEVGVPPTSDLLRPAPLYGVCETSHVWIKQRQRAVELNERLKIAQDTIKAKEQEMHFLMGALDDQDWNLHSWFGAQDTINNTFLEPPLAGMFRSPEPPPEPKKRGRPRKK